MKPDRIALAFLLSARLLALLPLASAEAQHTAMATRIDNAIERSVGCFESLPGVSSTELWFLLRAQQHLEPPRLGPVLERLQTRSRRDDMAALIDPKVSEEPPPPVGPKPWQDLKMLMRQSLTCRQGREPSQALQVFINEQHEGYVLTHQILAIQWARSLGCAVPTQWYARESALADRVLAELEADRAFSDLFAERVVVLGLVGKAGSLQGLWLEWLLQAQNPDGCWRSPQEKIRMHFRGYTLVSDTEEISPTHTSSLAVCALAHYRTTLRNANEDES